MVQVIAAFNQIKLFYLQMRNIVQNGPSFDVFAFFIDVMVIYRMEHE